MSIAQSKRIGIVLAPLPLKLVIAVLVVVSSSVVHAVDLYSRDGLAFPDVNPAIVEQSLTLRNVMNDFVGTDVIPLPGIAGTELALVVEFVNTAAVHGVQRAVQWAREVLSTMGLLDQCKLLEGVNYLGMPSLEAAIMSTKRTWDEYCSMGSLLTDPSVFWAAVGHHPGMSALNRAAHTPQQKDIVNQVHVALVYAGEGNAMLINSGTWVDQHNVLGWAISQGEEAVVELLMNVPSVEVHAFGSLHLAVERWQLDVLELLLKHLWIRLGDLPDQERNRLRSATTMLVNADDVYGMSPLHWAARRGHARVLKLFLEYSTNMDVNAINVEGKTALHWAAMNGHCNATEVLLAARRLNIAVNRIDPNGWTPLHWAAHNGHGCVAALLVRAPGMEINAPDSKRWTPLHYACQQNHLHVVQILVNNGNSDVINAPGRRLWTPLHLAVSWDRIEVVRALLQAADIDIEATDRAGLTALDIAEKIDLHDIAMLLRERRYESAGQDIRSSSGEGSV
ncbi:hypothetical protein PBRA_009039 [Plasmodiophora brassicae]|uniref:Uncharacterized protein n=1 Tax=Plasmodiophora brassicae TaxID=37360 RepID=A0A0G4J4E3_PLABS|nr:hypothetical protein PBRA_009039 [Plasmodiophora brassicae]